jgi:uncharacterized membrane protein YphA (DoxX/SURF4 family)
MKNILSNSYFLFAVRLLLGFLFIYSGVIKIDDSGYFVKSLDNYKLLPPEFVNFSALLIPAIELIIGTFLLLGIFVKETALVADIMMIVFIAAIITAMARGLDIECGCFGTSDGTRVGLIKIIENFFLLTGCALLSVFGSQFLSITDRRGK